MIGIAAGLAFCFACIFVGGGFLTSIGDRIASRTTLGHHLMGMLFLAAVTSLPELAAGISAAGVSGEADIAYGEVVGSCVFNLAILGVADLLSRTPVIAARGHGLYLNGATGVALLAAAAASLLVSDATGRLAALFNLVIVGVYLIGLEGARRSERQEAEPAGPDDGSSLARLWLLFGVTSLLVIGPGLWLPILADSLAEQTGASRSFVGTFLVGAVTSAPEAIVTYHCVRRGWGAMAVGNLLGSNLFNILILAPMDLVYRPGSLYEAAGSEHAVTALLAIIMTAVVLAAATWRRSQDPLPSRRPEGWILLVLYLVALLYLAPGLGLG
jgi:cation:H+ antiporter